MLVVIPSTLYGRVGAVLCALIVVASTLGLTMHSDFYAGVRRRSFYCYYTNLSNLIVLVYFALVAPRLYASARLRPLIPHAEFSVMMSIMLTFFVFHHLLFPSIRRAAEGAPRTRAFAIVCADNLFEHYLVPWLVFFYWLLCSPGKAALRAADALLWTAIPLAYLICILVSAPVRRPIAQVNSVYPYPFLDAGQRGMHAVLRTCAGLYAACAGAGLLVIIALHAGLSCFGGGHALVLI